MAQPVAVLVDGDNISGKYTVAILGIATKHGDPAEVRVFLDAQRASDWHGAIGYRLLHAGSGKNATDVFLAIDAMELVYTKAVKSFIIATSDGDFTHLAVRLRELSAKVIGVGEPKAPRAFRASCTSFVELGAQPTVKLVSKAPAGVTELDIRISTLPEKNWRTYLTARPTLFDLDPHGPGAMVRFCPTSFADVA